MYIYHETLYLNPHQVPDSPGGARGGGIHQWFFSDGSMFAYKFKVVIAVNVLQSLMFAIVALLIVA